MSRRRASMVTLCVFALVSVCLVQNALAGASDKRAKRPLAGVRPAALGYMSVPRPLIRLGRPHPVMPGLNDDWHVHVEDIHYASDLGARLIRFPISWQYVQPNGPDQWNWDILDRVAGEAAAHGLGMVLALSGTPQWTRGPAPRGSAPGDPLPPDPAYLPQWQAFVRQVVTRYPNLTAVEIWNEQNIPRFWGGSPNPGEYTRLLNSAYDAVKSVRPDLPVLYGGLCPIIDGSEGPGELGEHFYLSQSYAAGAKGHFDALSVHPYPGPPSRPDYLREIRLQLGDARRVMARHGDAAKPIWVTEAGFPTYQGPWRVTEAQQARRLSMTYRLLARVKNLPVVIVHRFRDTANPLLMDGGWGLLRHDYSPKPAYFTAQSLFRGP